MRCSTEALRPVAPRLRLALRLLHRAPLRRRAAAALLHLALLLAPAMPGATNAAPATPGAVNATPATPVAVNAAPATPGPVRAVKAAPERVERLDAAGWAALQAGLRAPALVVFTSTDCSHCPAVLAALARSPERARAGAALLTVVMDQAPGEDDAALLADPHYAVADRLLACAGPAQALRHAVNPAWRGVTPYAVLLRPDRAPQFVTGPVPAELLRAWAAAPGSAPARAPVARSASPGEAAPK